MKQIQCIKRKKLVQATPEELVRQKCIHWLVSNGVPIAFIEVEKSLSNWNPSSDERADLLIRHPSLSLQNGEFWALVECKALNTSVELTSGYNQLLRYQQSLHFLYGVVVGGDSMRIFEVNNSWAAIEQLPNWSEYL